MRKDEFHLKLAVYGVLLGLYVAVFYLAAVHDSKGLMFTLPVVSAWIFPGAAYFHTLASQKIPFGIGGILYSFFVVLTFPLYVIYLLSHGYSLERVRQKLGITAD